MKNTILILISLILSTVSMAQINKGALLYEGTVSLYANNSESEFSQTALPTEQNYTQFSFSPKVGLFTSGTILLGLGFSYEFQKSESTSVTFDPFLGSISTSTSSMKSNVFFLNPYIRKYIKLNDKLFLTITGNAFAGLGNASNKIKFNGNVLETNSNIIDLELNVTPGLTYFMSNQWALTANFGYLFYNYREQASSQAKITNHYYGGSLHFNTFGIGVQYLVRNNE